MSFVATRDARSLAERFGAPAPLPAGTGLLAAPAELPTRAPGQQTGVPAPVPADSGSYVPPVAPDISGRPLPLGLRYLPSVYDCASDCRHLRPDLLFPGFAQELAEVHAWRASQAAS